MVYTSFGNFKVFCSFEMKYLCFFVFFAIIFGASLTLSHDYLTIFSRLFHAISRKTGVFSRYFTVSHGSSFFTKKNKNVKCIFPSKKQNFLWEIGKTRLGRTELHKRWLSSPVSHIMCMIGWWTEEVHGWRIGFLDWTKKFSYTWAMQRRYIVNVSEIEKRQTTIKFNMNSILLLLRGAVPLVDANNERSSCFKRMTQKM